MSEIGTGKVVLVVEDDESIRATLQEALESDGYAVVTAANGKECMDALRRFPKTSVVLLDLMMPVMTGREFLDALLVDRVLGIIPVIVVSANADEKTAAGARAYLKKPADLEKLLALVSKFAV